MPKIPYAQIKFGEEAIRTIQRANKIIDAYLKKGFGLTLRQLYYQFVAHDYFDESRRFEVRGNKWVRSVSGTKNAQPNYTWLGKVVADGRMAGLIDWLAITDRTRASRANQHWTKPTDILADTLNTYAIDKWANQDHYVECWVEKDALSEVVGAACTPLDVRYFACRGYTSTTAMWEASQRVMDQLEKGKQVHVIHLGDHDPSGIDMSRDIEEKLELFSGSRIHLDRIALNMDQIRKYNPPPDPAKETDSRFAGYQELYGDQSWELDSLEPSLLVNLIQESINEYRDLDKWAEMETHEKRGKLTLESIIHYFPEVVKLLRTCRSKDKSAVVCAECGATVNNPECRCDVEKRGILLG